MSSADSAAVVLCELTSLFDASGRSVNNAVTNFASGGASVVVKVFLYAFAGLAALNGLLALASILARAWKGSLWLVRPVHTPTGIYLSPHAAVTFSIASIFTAIGLCLMAAWANALFEGRVPRGLIIMEAIAGWVPLWLGGFSQVWGTAIATLNLQRSRRSLNGAPTPQGRFFISPILFNSFVLLFPLLACAATITVFIFAQRHLNAAFDSLYDVFQVISSFDADTGCNFSFLQQVEATIPLLSLSRARIQVLKFYRIGFSIWTGLIFLLCICWIPFFATQYDVLRQQIRHASKARRRQRRALAQAQSDNLTRLPPSISVRTESGSRYGSSGGPTSTVTSAHLVKMRGAYRGLLGTSVFFAAMVIGYLGLAIWIVVDPAVIAHGEESSNVILLLSLAIFGFFGLVMNAINFCRAVASPPQLYSSNGSPSSLRLTPLSPRYPVVFTVNDGQNPSRSRYGSQHSHSTRPRFDSSSSEPARPGVAVTPGRTGPFGALPRRETDPGPGPFSPVSARPLTGRIVGEQDQRSRGQYDVLPPRSPRFDEFQFPKRYEALPRDEPGSHWV